MELYLLFTNVLVWHAHERLSLYSNIFRILFLGTTPPSRDSLTLPRIRIVLCDVVCSVTAVSAVCEETVITYSLYADCEIRLDFQSFLVTTVSS